MDYVKMMGVDHFIQRLYVHWDITTMCQYKCSYCYARRQYGEKWGTPGIWKNQLRVVDELSKSTLPIFIGLLGGEPTYHHKYFELIDLIVENVITDDRSRMYITTNGAKDSSFFERHRNADGKIFMLWSLHPEFTGDEEFENFYNNVVLMHGKGYRSKVNLMLHPNEKYWAVTKERYERLAELDYLILHPHFVYDGHNNNVEYSDEFYEFYSFLENQRVKEFVFSDGKDEFILSDYEIFTKGLNKFQGWKCWHNNFEINLNGKITDQCFNNAIDIPKDFFKDIKKIEPKTCPHEFCSCDGLMKIYKEK